MSSAEVYGTHGTMSVIQLVPHRTEGPDGIGDYAQILAEELRSGHGLDSAFLSGTSEHEEPLKRDHWKTVAVNAKTASSLSQTLVKLQRETPAGAVLIHVAGYGYSKRGAPVWLLRGLKAWRRSQPKVRLIGVFHELYAKGNNPLTSSYWMGGLQKYVARSIWGLCDAAITTNSDYRAELALWRPENAGKISLQPVFSNLGEPARILPIELRPVKLLVFGRPGTERLYLGQRLAVLESVVKALHIAAIMDIGARNGSVPDTVADVPVEKVGFADQSHVSRLMLDCRFGILELDPQRLGKSGVFAAMCSHGVVPIVMGSKGRNEDGLTEGIHYLTPSSNFDGTKFLQVQRQSAEWYRSHGIESQAKNFYSMISGAYL